MTFSKLVDDRVLLRRISSALDHLPVGQVPVAIRHNHPLLEGVAHLWGLRVALDLTLAPDGFEVDTHAPSAVVVTCQARPSRPRVLAPPIRRPLQEPPKPDPEPGGPLGRLRRWWRRLDGQH